MQITVEGLKPYDGTYELDFVGDLTTREWGWLKRLSGYMPLTIDEGIDGNDPELFCVLALVALHRAGKLEPREVPALFERLADLPERTSVTVDLGPAEEEAAEDDASPPERSSNGSSDSSGIASPTSSETSPASPSGSGTTGSASSVSEPATSGS